MKKNVYTKIARYYDGACYAASDTVPDITSMMAVDRHPLIVALKIS
jgi:hypothetical protein